METGRIILPSKSARFYVKRVVVLVAQATLTYAEDNNEIIPRRYEVPARLLRHFTCVSLPETNESTWEKIVTV